MKLSIVIPVYNEEQTIGEVVERVWAADLGDISLDLTLTVALALRRCRLQSRFFRSGILSGIGALSFFGRFFDRHFGFIRQAISASLDDSIARLDAR